MTNLILTEQLIPNECKLIQESTNGGKDLYVSGIFMQSEQKNRNGRIYPLNEMQAAVKSMNETILENKGIFGELDHPPGGLQINLDRVSHVITELRMHGNDVYGKAKIIETPMGLIAKTLIESGVRFGVSSRGTGSVMEDGNVSGYICSTIDLVANPSAHNATPTAVYESIQNARNGKEIQSLAEAVIHDQKAQAYLKKELMKFMRELTSKK